jgi:hypothetical protein
VELSKRTTKCNRAIPFNIRTSLSRIYVFHSYTVEEFQAQNLLPLKNSKIPSSKPCTSEEFHAQNLYPMTNSNLKTLYYFASFHFEKCNMQATRSIPPYSLEISCLRHSPPPPPHILQSFRHCPLPL